LINLGESGLPILKKGLSDPDPIIQEFVRKALSGEFKKGTTLSKPQPIGSSGLDPEAEKKKGWIFFAVGAAALLLSLILCIASIFVLSAADGSNDTSMAFGGLTCCMLPLLIIGIVLLVWGLIKVFRK
ncbi:hypothetical protein ACFLXB_02445, partial [Chloroflexota bacterium]